MLPIFKATKYYNHAKEAILLLIQPQKLSDRMRGQLLWARSINTRGREVCNIPCDLHMEHFNRWLKTVWRSMGAHIISTAILCVSRSLYVVQNAWQQFQSETCSATSTHSAHAGRHKHIGKTLILSHGRKCISTSEGKISSVMYIQQGFAAALLHGTNLKTTLQ